MKNFISSTTSFLLTYNEYVYTSYGEGYYKLDLSDETASYQADRYSVLGFAGEILFGGSIMWIYDDRLFIFNKSKQVCRTAKETTPCEENTLIITQGKYKGISQAVALYNIPVTTGKITWPVQDVVYYKDGKYHTTLPTYYGNGTAWKKLK